MCARYSLSASPEEIATYFRLLTEPRVEPRYNIAPTQPVLIVRDVRDRAADAPSREATHVHWGLVPKWASDPSIAHRLINARSETAMTKPAFRDAMKYRRCLLPFTGFYEWTGPKGAREPHFIYRETGELFAVAGLWDHWQDAHGSELESATILTTEANGMMSALHDRMPVILPEEAFDLWLNCDVVDPVELRPWLEPAPHDLLTHHAVSTRVNATRHEGPGLIERVPEQGTLF